jgi:phosphoglycerol transferase MdoB-like AlkP superfamily enzyme
MPDAGTKDVLMFFLFLIAEFAALTALGAALRAYIFLRLDPSSALGTGEVVRSGLTFDAAAASIFTLPFFLYAAARLLLSRRTSVRFSWCFAVMPAVLLAGFMLGDSFYLEEAGRHASSEMRALFPNFIELTLTAFTSHPGLTAAVGAGAVIALLLLRPGFSFRADGRKTSVSLQSVLFLAVSLVLFRGFGTVPQRPSTAWMLGSEELSVYAMNGAFSSVYGLVNGSDLQRLYQALGERETFSRDEAGSRKLPRPSYNVVLLLLESWPAEYTDRFVTPHLEALRERSFHALAAVADGKRTHEGLYAALCSAPNPFGAGVPRTGLDRFEYHCLPEIMESAGYDTAIFQGTTGDLVAEFAALLGVRRSFDRHNVDAVHPKSNWGLADTDLYAAILSEAAKAEKPFFYIVNNTDTHDFTIPEEFGWKFGDELRSDREKSVLYYADSELHEFMEKFRSGNGLPTLFAVTGDHTRMSKSSPLSSHLVPLIFFSTDGKFPVRHIDSIASQLDIAPTVLGFLGGRAPWFLGRNLLTEEPGLALFFEKGSLYSVLGRHVTAESLKTGGISCYYADLPFSPSRHDCTAAELEFGDLGAGEAVYQQSMLFDGKTAVERRASLSEEAEEQRILGADDGALPVGVRSGLRSFLGSAVHSGLAAAAAVLAGEESGDEPRAGVFSAEGS